MGNNTSAEQIEQKKKAQRKAKKTGKQGARDGMNMDISDIVNGEEEEDDKEIAAEDIDFEIPQDEFIEHADSSTLNSEKSTSVILKRRSTANTSNISNQQHNNTIHDDIINKDDDEIEANKLLDYMNSDTKYKDITVPVAIKWKGNATEVFVIGSFTNWMSKIRLNQISPGEFTIQLFLPIGIYRFQFLVDGETKCSNNLPKATEANGNFVNWFEVVKNNTNQSQGNYFGTVDFDLQTHYVQKPDHHYSGKVTKGQNDDYFGPISEDMNSLRLHSQSTYTISSDTLNEFPKMNLILTPVPRQRVEYTNDIPMVYTDTDDFDETVTDSSSMLKKKGLAEPPALPPYLNNVLLNKKDVKAASNSHGILRSPRNTPSSNPTNDANILSVPNHVILNHLITTSIKSNVLAVACINRYAGKFITQVTYSPIDSEKRD